MAKASSPAETAYWLDTVESISVGDIPSLEDRPVRSNGDKDSGGGKLLPGGEHNRPRDETEAKEE